MSEIKDDLSRFLREAEPREFVITRHGKPAGLLIGFESEEDWFDCRLENDPRFPRRNEQVRNSLQDGRGIRLEDFETKYWRDSLAHVALLIPRKELGATMFDCLGPSIPRHRRISALFQ